MKPKTFIAVCVAAVLCTALVVGSGAIKLSGITFLIVLAAYFGGLVLGVVCITLGPASRSLPWALRLAGIIVGLATIGVLVQVTLRVLKSASYGS